MSLDPRTWFAALAAAWARADERACTAYEGGEGADDPWPDVTALVNEVNARPKPEPVEGPPF